MLSNNLTISVHIEDYTRIALCPLNNISIFLFIRQKWSVLKHLLSWRQNIKSLTRNVWNVMNVSVISCIFLMYFVCPVVGMINRTTYRLHGDNALRKLVVWSKLLWVFLSFQTFIFNLYFFTLLILIRLPFIKNISHVSYALNKSHRNIWLVVAVRSSA